MTPDGRILHALRAAGRALSVSELAAEAKLPPGALEERIDGLRAAGYEIELAPHAGYRLRAIPDRLIADDLAARLGGTSEKGGPLRIAREIVVFEQTASTNDVAARLARAGAAEGVAIFAEQQTAGRGRLGRRWDSAARKGLWFSLLLRPRLAISGWTRLTTWAALGVARGLEEALPGCRAAIKWPNDVYLRGRKVAGILIESVAGRPGGPDQGGFAIVGIGVNVNQTAADFSGELAGRATSLRMVAGEEALPLDRQEVAATLLKRLDALYGQLDQLNRAGEDESDRFASWVAEAESRSLLLGKWVEIAAPGAPEGSLRGMAEGLEPDGSLRLRDGEGRVFVVSGGEVTVSGWEGRPGW